MADSPDPSQVHGVCLGDAVDLNPAKLQNPEALSLYGGMTGDGPILVVLAAGKGTRFGTEPKCIQPVRGTPLARHSIDAFRRFWPGPAICLVGYRHAEVSAALGADNAYVLSAAPAGGTALAAFEAFSIPQLAERNPALIITMGDRIVPSSTYRRLWDTHCGGPQEADLTLLTARYEPPRNRGKGRVVRDRNGRVQRIVEERDIPTANDGLARWALLNLTEGNCPLYVIRAKTLLPHLRQVGNANAQGQFYLTDVVEAISRAGGEIRTVTVTVADPEYDLLCSDVTQPMDLALLEGIMASAGGLLSAEELEVEEAAGVLTAGRPACQIAAIARQLDELAATASSERLGFQGNQPLAIGISGGRLRIAFMHPDMLRFYGPAWQMPIGAGNAAGSEQIVVLVQRAEDRRINLYPMNPEYRESINFVPADDDAMYPDEHISDLHSYEQFGTRMSESLLLSLGYFSDEELEQRRKRGLPLPPASRWLGGNMRRPFTLVGNAIASMRTLRAGNLGAQVQKHLGRAGFTGLRLVSTGSIPQGGFSSSSAVTVAVKNALNALYGLGLPPDLLVHLACQAEYGTGVRAGSLDQATEQKGKAGQGTLISSNPKDNYRILGAYPVPTDRIRILFPYSVERDREAWRWSWGAYAESPGDGPLTAQEMRKMTGKAAEIAAMLVRLPLETDFFKQIEDDLLSDGLLSLDSRRHIGAILQRVPLCIGMEDLAQRVLAEREWLRDQMIETHRLDRGAANEKADAALAALLAGWREPVLRRGTPAGVVEERGVPLRAMLAYLFGEVAKNFFLIHHPDQWIEYVTLSQRGDRHAELDPERLPDRADLERTLDWETGHSGPQLLDRWLGRHGAVPVDYNRGLDDESLAADPPPDFHRLEGSSFFRGLALIDLAEAMLKRAFGAEAVAVRVNAAGQGDYFQVHVDTRKALPDDVKQFLRLAFYRRFDIAPNPEFVELHPGAGAVGLRLSRAEALPQLIRRLRAHPTNG